MLVAGAITVEIGNNLLQLFTLIATSLLTGVLYRRTKELRPNGGHSMKDKISQHDDILHAIESDMKSLVANRRVNDQPERLPE